MTKLTVRSKRPLGGVKVGTARSEKQAQVLAVRHIKPKHRAIVKRGNLYDIYIF